MNQIPYTPRLKKILALAYKEARELQHSYVGPEHAVLGILREKEGWAAKHLEKLGVSYEEFRNSMIEDKTRPHSTMVTEDPIISDSIKELRKALQAMLNSLPE